MTEKIEYRVRPVTRFVVTRYHDSGPDVMAKSETKGEFENANSAYDVAYALCRAEHESLGLPVDTPKVVYPKRVEQGVQIGGVAVDTWDLQNWDDRARTPKLSLPGDDSCGKHVKNAPVKSKSPIASPEEIAQRKELDALPYIKISFRPSSVSVPKSYMEAHSSFPARPGETHRRGNDLPDGPFTAETFQRILERTKQVLREHGMEG